MGADAARRNRLAVYSVSAACAEFFASVALCPLEATRIRLVSDKGFARGLVDGFGKIFGQEGVRGFYGGFGPILLKQYVFFFLPFTPFLYYTLFLFSSLFFCCVRGTKGRGADGSPQDPVHSDQIRRF